MDHTVQRVFDKIFPQFDEEDAPLREELATAAAAAAAAAAALAPPPERTRLFFLALSLGGNRRFVSFH